MNSLKRIFRRLERKPDIVRLREFQALHHDMQNVLAHVVAAEKGWREVEEALAAMCSAIDSGEGKS